MATTQSPAPPTASADSAAAPQDITNARVSESHAPAASTPVEMSTLSSNPNESKSLPSSAHPLTTIPPSEAQKENTTQPSTNLATTTSRTDSDPRMTQMSRAYSTAIGPNSDQPMPIPKDQSLGPVLMITLLLTTGARHPFKLDPKYLVKRGVDVENNDPYSLSVYKLKELILREWREEWEQKPSSPSSIRLISFGKLLDDKAPLKDFRFNHDTPNVVHMTVKPQDFVEEEDAKGGKASLRRNSGNAERSPGCRCIVM